MSFSKRSLGQSLKYRWGVVGVIFAVAGLIWFANSTGIMRNTKDVQENLNVKIVCPRCEGEPGRKENCALCRGTGYLWVDKTKYLPGEIESVE
ncbi:MAG TPA: hypothetical protein PLD40_07040 [Kiritimatiellia bacterium]|jgi:hypothetical protein|nr:hypothetical protein [Kiritimatiellia bacterium]OQC56263.1 MAG: hypothetical protein BWX54_01490 [Verrucomicrobia bacterium ADurb.Bin018]HOE00729.1 hypothetical protein [Kiritimatiellia bacterium]HOE37487.1 hypothetical protein [Kiritimatiellia bacterium]HOR74738.1 hypothetical protein [Kiritimatiellia bacterium]